MAGRSCWVGRSSGLLAVLLLHAGTVVSADRLIDELWGEEPPETARNVLQVYGANLPARCFSLPGGGGRPAYCFASSRPATYSASAHTPSTSLASSG
jgi:hypothetical protein